MLREADKEKDKKKKIKGFKDFDGSKYINTEPTLDEAAMPDAAVISFGRMNPVTNGHEKLVDKVNKVANQVKGTPLVYLSHSQDKKKNPLSYEDKIKFAQAAFGPIVQKSPAKTIIQIAQSLTGKYKNLVMVVGSDRVKEFDSLLQKYNGKDFNFDSIKVVSAGQRDPDAEGVSGMSASKMRALAADNEVSKFKKGLPKRLQSNASQVLAAVRKGMNMSEENELLDGEQLDEVLTRQQRRRRAMLMKRMKHKIKRGQDKAKRRTASMEVLKRRARKKAIMALKQRFAKHRRFADLSSGEKETIEKRVSKFSKKRLDQMARKLLPKVKAAERARRKNMAKTKLKEDLDLNTKFESFLNEGLWGTYNTKRPHQLMDEKGRVKFDKRFKMYKSKNEVNEDLQWEDLMDLVESTEAFAEDYYKGVAQDKKDDRKAHFKKYAEKPGDGADKDSNYKDAPGDIGKDGERVKTKLSKHTKKYRKMYGEDLNEWVCGQCNCDPCCCEAEISEDATAALKKKAEKTGMPLGVLRQVYNRGKAAWKSGHRPGTTPEQWGHARVNSFVTKSSGTWGKADADLAAKVRGSSKKESIDEVLDTPKAMDSYRNKAKASKEKAASSAVAKMVRSKDKDTREHPAAELKTMAKRTAGQKMADRLAKRKTFKKLRGEEVEQLDELSPRTKASYLKKASAQNKKVQKAYDKSVKSSPDAFFGDDSPEDQKRMKTMTKRQKGIAMAKGRKYGQQYESREDELAHHSAGLKDAEERISRAGSTEEMIKAMNKKSHHARALAKLHRMEDVNNKFEAFLESKDMDELNLSFKDVTKTGNKPVFKAMKADKTKSDLEDLKAKLAKYGKPKVKNEESMEDLAHVANKAKVEKEKKDSDKIVVKKKVDDKERTSIMDEEGGAGDEGTDKLVKKFKKDTPNCSD